ncbi:hypothetical protein Tco_0078183 [Tanacetum coccineum]
MSSCLNRLQLRRIQYTFKINPIAELEGLQKRKKKVLWNLMSSQQVYTFKEGINFTCSKLHREKCTPKGCKASAGGRVAGASGSQAASVTATQQEHAASQQGAAATQGDASSASLFKRTKSTACRLTPTK